jgi:proteasome lid subunit RPN8/RPN11
MRDPAKHPWITGNLVIRKTLLDRVYAEARAAYARDEESCGLLVGRVEEPLVLDGIVPLENRANKLHAKDPESYPRTGRMYFDINPLVFARELREGEAANRPVKVLYHSHLDTGAYFSETDAATATMGGDEPAYDVAYLVTSIYAGEVRAHELFVWSLATRAFVPTGLRVVEEGAQEAP